MKALKIDEDKTKLVRNKRKGKVLIAKRVLGKEIEIRCIRCALRFSSACIPLIIESPCNDFLPDHVFFEDEDNTNWRGESKTDPK